jgi:hypothetical protein
VWINVWFLPSLCFPLRAGDLTQSQSLIQGIWIQKPRKREILRSNGQQAIKIYIHRSYTQKYTKLKYIVIKKKLKITETLLANSCFSRGILEPNPREKRGITVHANKHKFRGRRLRFLNTQYRVSFIAFALRACRCRIIDSWIVVTNTWRTSSGRGQVKRENKCGFVIFIVVSPCNFL